MGREFGYEKQDEYIAKCDLSIDIRRHLVVHEVCPASTLKEEDLYLPYKGSSEDHRQARRDILENLERKEVKIQSTELRSTVIGDAGGDALDSVVAAVATYRAWKDPAFPKLAGLDDRESYAVEGYIYVRQK